MQRRQLLQLGLAGLGTAALPTQLWAAGPDTPRLLVVFLRGAYDAANLLVPTSSSFYYESRPNIAIAKTAALPLDLSIEIPMRLHRGPDAQPSRAPFRVPLADIEARLSAALAYVHHHLAAQAQTA